jgi:hypothetical protein
MVDIAKFWKMIEVAREVANGRIKKQLDILVEALSKESDEDIIEFDQIMGDLQDKTYLGYLWDACEFIRCGCSEEDFADFRVWLIAQGEAVFDKAIENPESLADIVNNEDRKYVVYERFAYVGAYAYAHKNDKQIPYISREEKLHLNGEMHTATELPQLFPKLMAKLGSCTDWESKYLDDYLNKSRDNN